MRTEKLPFFSSRRTPRISSASSGEMPCACRRSWPLAREPLVPDGVGWRPVVGSSGRRGSLVLGTAYCIQNRSVKVKHIVVPALTKIGLAYQSPGSHQIERADGPRRACACASAVWHSLARRAVAVTGERARHRLV